MQVWGTSRAVKYGAYTAQSSIGDSQVWWGTVSAVKYGPQRVKYGAQTVHDDVRGTAVIHSADAGGIKDGVLTHRRGPAL